METYIAAYIKWILLIQVQLYELGWIVLNFLWGNNSLRFNFSWCKFITTLHETFNQPIDSMRHDISWTKTGPYASRLAYSCSRKLDYCRFAFVKIESEFSYWERSNPENEIFFCKLFKSTEFLHSTWQFCLSFPMFVNR